MSSSSKAEISPKTLQALRQTWGKVRYLIIEEISMVSRTFLARLSATISAAKQNDEAAFGRINVIICGDFHQFPPVACPEWEALFWQNNPAQDSPSAMSNALSTNNSVQWTS
jgi:hypothetical protein